MIRNRLKRTISASSGLRLLQMVSELGTERRASEDVEPLRGVNREIPHQLKRGTSANEDAGSRRRWIVRFHIS